MRLLAATLLLSAATASAGAAQPFIGHWTSNQEVTGHQNDYWMEMDIWVTPSGHAGTVTYYASGSTTAICAARLTQRAIDLSDSFPFLELTEDGCGRGVVTIAGGRDEGLFGREGGAERPGAMEQYALRTGPAVQPASRPVSAPKGPAAGGQRVLQLGQPVSGQLGSGDPLASDQTYYEDYVFVAPTAMRVRITMRSAEFDAYLMAAVSADLLARDDDSAGGTDARVEMDVPAGATVLIRANALSQGMQGAYTLEVTGA